MESHMKLYHMKLSSHTILYVVFNMTLRQACSLERKRNLRSKIRWFTEFCNSHYLSQLATFFIDARAKRSTVRSCICLALPLKWQSKQRY